MDEKLQKVLARVGLGSRREMEKWIEAGRVQVNGKTATLGDRIKGSDNVLVDGNSINSRYQHASRTRVLLYNKPEGEICTRSDPDGRATVYDNLPKLKGERWVSVGRLDFNTSGLLLFTTDGALANALMHPSNTIEREYAVRIRGEVDDAMIKRLKEGVLLDDGVAKFSAVQAGRGDSDKANHWYYVVIMEGRNREVRRLWESQGVAISRLKRVRFGNIFIPSKVKVGQWLEFSAEEIETLLAMAGTTDAIPAELLPEERQDMERQERKARPRPALKKAHEGERYEKEKPAGKHTEKRLDRNRNKKDEISDRRTDSRVGAKTGVQKSDLKPSSDRRGRAEKKPGTKTFAKTPGDSYSKTSDSHAKKSSAKTSRDSYASTDTKPYPKKRGDAAAKSHANADITASTKTPASARTRAKVDKKPATDRKSTLERSPAAKKPFTKSTSSTGRDSRGGSRGKK